MRRYFCFESEMNQAAKKAGAFLQQGQIILYPTETIYGFGVDATNQKAVSNVAHIKHISQAERKNRGYILLVKDLQMAKKYALFSQKARQLALKYWPGAVTLVVPLKKDAILDHCAQEGAIALRVSSDPFIGQIFKYFNKPIVSTSANITGQRPFSTARAAMNYFKSKQYQPDAIFDAGEIKNSKPSTIVSCIAEDIKIIRQGLIAIKI